MRAVTLLLLFGACSRSSEDAPGGPDPYDVEIGPYDVDIRWTSYGIPHLVAEDYGSLAFGMGHAHARDHICTLADQIVKIRSERSLYFGPGDEDQNLDSDFGWLGLKIFEQAEAGFLTLEKDLQRGLVGYAAGYNHYLDEVGPQGLPAPCRGASWVQPVTHIDLLAYYLHLGQFGSGYALVKEVGNARPPSALRAAAQPPPIERLDYFKRPPIGSNGWALGADRSETGRGMVLSNTHFPAEGERQWWESHLTIPGELDVYGASLIGVPLINIGFNRHVAWTHTVSNTPRFVVYQLELDPTDPKKYLYDGKYVEMEERTYSVRVLEDDGVVRDRTRTLYRSRWGPIFNAPVIGWTPINAYTWRDVNDNNLAMTSTWFAMNRAHDLDTFEAAHREYQGIPWVHTIFADDQGNALYLDSAATPNLSPAAEDAYVRYRDDDVISGLFADFGVWVVQGSNPVNTWVEDSRARRPGAVPYDEAPRLLRRDFVNNSNDNYWLANPLEPLEGYPLIYGETGTPRTPRNRMNNRYLLERQGAAGDDDRFSLEELRDAALSARSSLAMDLRDQVVARCQGADPVEVELDDVDHVVDLTQACDILADWDLTSSVDSVGATIWRELVGSELLDYDDLSDAGDLFADSFDPSDPIYTPHQLAPATDTGDPVLEALAAGIVRLGQASVPLDARLGDVQFRMLGSERIETLGGPYLEGVIAVASWEQGANTTLLPVVEQTTVINDKTGLTDTGYLINAGNSWVMAVEFTEEGPRAEAVMVYSQSEDADAEHFADQSRLYAQPAMRPVLFEEDDILADPELVQRTLTLDGPN